MKTPKSSTPAAKSKINTPRSGFIKKNSSSSKKVKFNIHNNVTNSGNETPKLQFSFTAKKKDNIGSGKKNKSPLITKVSPNSKENIETNSSPSKKNKGNSKENIEKNSSPRKVGKLALEDSLSKEETPNKEMSPKAGNKFKNSPSKNNNSAKTSPEVQLGLDIEQLLDNDYKTLISKKKRKVSPQSTPLSNNKQKKDLTSKSTDNQDIKKDNQAVKGQKKNIQPKIISNKGSKKSLSSDETTCELVDSVTLKNAVTALKKHIDSCSKQKEDILSPTVPFSLQINYIKLPYWKHSRILVPHSILEDNCDICLFVADKKIQLKDPEDLRDNVKERLRKCGIDYITEVMPWRKALREHTQFEERRKLLNRFDLFLIENKLAKIKTALTSSFSRSKKLIPVTLVPESKMKASFEAAVRKIPVLRNHSGLTKSIPFGHYAMDTKKLVENLEAILKVVSNEKICDGGSANVRSIMIKSAKSPAFPLYITTKSSNEVKLPKSKPVNKGSDDIVEGELTTLMNHIVRVSKDGTVKTIKMKTNQQKAQATKKIKTEGVGKLEELEMEEENNEELEDDDDLESEDIDDDDDDIDDEEEGDDDDDDDDEEEEEEDEEEESDDERPMRAKKDKQVKTNGSIDDSSTDDEQLEEAEQNFLNELRLQQDEIESKRTQKKVQNQTLKQKKGMQQKAKQNVKSPKNQMQKSHPQPNPNKPPVKEASEVKQQQLQGNKKPQISKFGNKNKNVGGNNKNGSDVPSKNFMKKKWKNKKGKTNNSPAGKQGPKKSLVSGNKSRTG